MKLNVICNFSVFNDLLLAFKKCAPKIRFSGVVGQFTLRSQIIIEPSRPALARTPTKNPKLQLQLHFQVSKEQGIQNLSLSHTEFKFQYKL